MRFKRHLLTALTLATAAGMLVGCAQPAAETPAEPAPETLEPVSLVTEYATPTPPPAPSALDTYEASFEVADVDGYVMSVTVRHLLTEVELDTSSEKPGYTAAFFGTSDDYFLQNMTPEYDIEFKLQNGVTSPANQPVLQLWAGWNTGSVICGDSTNEDGCAIGLTMTRLSQPLISSTEYSPEVNRGLPNGAGTAGVAGLSTDAGEAELEAALISPDFYLVTYTGADMSRFPSLCDDGAEGSIALYYAVLHSSTGDCRSPSLLQQPAARS